MPVNATLRQLNRASPISETFRDVFELFNAFFVSLFVLENHLCLSVTLFCRGTTLT